MFDRVDRAIQGKTARRERITKKYLSQKNNTKISSVKKKIYIITDHGRLKREELLKSVEGRASLIQGHEFY
ncbi:hypothetical protein RDI58_022856 [Solanum bulbocastanum]|uniref:Uncharacterized protein n=1 Tax=Solanum bulbocastanum TaxID=147425 RepID=A0AAN8Y662_SOLBU